MHWSHTLFISAILHVYMYNTYVDFETDVTFSQLNVWSAEQHMTSDRRCYAGVNGDVIGWKDLENADIDGAFNQAPSVCDGTLKTVMEYKNV